MRIQILGNTFITAKTIKHSKTLSFSLFTW